MDKKLTVIYDGDVVIHVREKDESEFTFIDSTSDMVTGTISDLKLMMTSIGVTDLSKFDDFETEFSSRNNEENSIDDENNQDDDDEEDDEEND